MNLLGWVTLALYGLAYRALPEAVGWRLARLQFWLATLGPLAFCGGLTALRLGDDRGFPFAVAGVFATLGAMFCFAIVLLRALAIAPDPRTDILRRTA